VPSKNAKEHNASDEQEENEENGDDEDDEDGEEYEIEAILEARNGSFPEGRTGYLVKWKGYSEEHNSWVDEQDAQGAKELIDEFWKKNSKKGAPRKSDAKPKPTPKPRKSAARATTHESEVESVTAPAKKRGRQSKASARSPSEEQEQAEEEVPKKKPRKGSNATATKSASARRAVARPEDSDQEEEERVYVDMSKWKDAASWEHLIECIDTVERTEDNELLVYFTLKNGKGFGRETTEVCKRKMPNLLIDFYQGNLRWKPSDENA
ncbi:hypothetical protein K466DRAFT_464112, partial [Polyporus arcularius HHB13444]